MMFKRCLLSYVLTVLTFLLIFNFSALASIDLTDPPEKDATPSVSTLQNPPYSILLVEEGSHSLGIYSSETGKEVGRVALSNLPHEIAVSEDGKVAYIPNFGLRDYDL